MSGITVAPAPAPLGSRALARKYLWLRVLSSPLWVCFLIAVLVRAWLIIHTHGVLDGDEATVGIQAEHILRGELPIYFYSQPYMGSLEAYFVSFIFRFTGPAVWAMRLEAIPLCLGIVYLTWRFAAALADAAALSPRVKTFFMTIASLVAAFPPLYDAVEEMRIKGGYTEAFLIMLWLLFGAFRLTQRWSQQASRRELALRWAGLGFLVGLGFWVDPLVMYACLAILLWIGGYILWELVKRDRQPGTRPRQKLLCDTLLFLTAVPTCLIGFIPGLIWGAQNNWANLSYIFHNGGNTFSFSRLHTILKVQKIYATCLVPRVMGGALPTQPDVTLLNPGLLTFGLVVAGLSLVPCAMSIVFSLGAEERAFTRMRQLTSLPLLFVLSSSLIFCFASISIAATYAPCGPVDLVGRYVVPLAMVLPFLIAAAFVFPFLLLQERDPASVEERTTTTRPSASRKPFLWVQSGLLIVLALYILMQGIAYAQAHQDYTFHPTGCVAENPTDFNPIIHYLQQQHIRYIWASSWLGNPITFETDSAIIAPDRTPGYRAMVLHADRPSILFVAHHNDPDPAFLQALNAHHIRYHAVRFFSEPGFDVLIVTPLNQTVSPQDPAFTSLFQPILIGCA